MWWIHTDETNTQIVIFSKHGSTNYQKKAHYTHVKFTYFLDLFLQQNIYFPLWVSLIFWLYF